MYTGLVLRCRPQAPDPWGGHPGRSAGDLYIIVTFIVIFVDYPFSSSLSLSSSSFPGILGGDVRSRSRRV